MTRPGIAMGEPNCLCSNSRAIRGRDFDRPRRSPESLDNEGHYEWDARFRVILRGAEYNGLMTGPERHPDAAVSAEVTYLANRSQ